MGALATVRRFFARRASGRARSIAYAKHLGYSLGKNDAHADLAAAPYRGGEINRLNNNWVPQHYDADAAIGEDRDTWLARVRDLGRNDPSIVALNGAVVDNVVGTGIATSAAAMVNGELEEDFNQEADELFDEWAESTEPDARGKSTWADMQREAFGDTVETGESLLLACALPEPDRIVPLCFQVLEAEQIDSFQDRPASGSQNEIRQGVEIDSFGRPVAYYLFGAHPNDPHATTSESARVPASRVIHYTLPGRPAATRGVSLYRSIMQSARDLDNYLGAELTSATIGSLFSLIHKTKKPGVGLGLYPDDDQTDPATDNPLARLGKGIVCQISSDDEIDQVDPKRPSASSEVFVKLMLMLTGMGGRVSRYRLTRDYSGTTYVAARAAHLDDRAAFRPMQHRFGGRVVSPIRRAFMAQAAALGRLTHLSATQYRAQRRRWNRHLCRPTGWEQIDPEKETDAALARIAAGLSTLEEECAARGKNWRQVILQRKREREFAERHGVPLNYDRPSMPAKNANTETNEQPAEA